ncbi:hypothetical protein FACS1894106_3250 [Spirochaetia bacterium]|nr:hypothetical protein FACS1894106_3250 [Spirochaetia bacterium]
MFRSLRHFGLRVTLSKIKQHLTRKSRNKQLAASMILSPEERKKQEAENFIKNVKFSIITPLYNTNEKMLREMIVSVQSQTYKNWELCLADGSDDKYSLVGKICMEYAKSDARIKYRKLEQNLGISGNSNACIDMANGDYLGLLDHDDIPSISII